MKAIWKTLMQNRSIVNLTFKRVVPKPSVAFLESRWASFIVQLNAMQLEFPNEWDELAETDVFEGFNQYMRHLNGLVLAHAELVQLRRLLSGRNHLLQPEHALPRTRIGS